MTKCNIREHFKRLTSTEELFHVTYFWSFSIQFPDFSFHFFVIHVPRTVSSASIHTEAEQIPKGAVFAKSNRNIQVELEITGTGWTPLYNLQSVHIQSWGCSIYNRDVTYCSFKGDVPEIMNYRSSLVKENQTNWNLV